MKNFSRKIKNLFWLFSAQKVRHLLTRFFLFMKNASGGNINGFTLIELLVVVLIIGILSAAAIPKYERSVWISRARLLQMAVKQVADAQERYYLENGECAKSFEELDISFDSLQEKTATITGLWTIYPLSAMSSDAIRGNSDFEIALAGQGGDKCWTTGRFKRGPFKGSSALATKVGVVFLHYDNRYKIQKRLYCAEGTSKEGEFCTKLFGIKDQNGLSVQNVMLYAL